MGQLLEKLRKVYNYLDNRGAHEADTLAEVIEELENPWISMEFAPKDGSWILAYGCYIYPRDGDVTEYYYRIKFVNTSWHCEGDEVFNTEAFNCWIPIPQLPIKIEPIKIDID